MRKIYVEPGDTVTVILPWSEVCLSMGVADRRMSVQVLPDGVQLIEDGRHFSFPITHGEAGFHRESDGRLCYYKKGQ